MTINDSEHQQQDDPCYVISIAARPRNTRREGTSTAGERNMHLKAVSIAPPSSVSFQSMEADID